MYKQRLSKNSSPGSKVINQVLTGLAMVLVSISMLAQADIVTLGDGESKYEIYLESHVGNTWTYSVKEVAGKSLSHWNVGIQSCIDNNSITAHSPVQNYDITDGSTSFEGIKWDVEESFTSGTFSFTLNADYPEITTIKVQAKAGSRGNERTGTVTGPDCSNAPSNEQPTDDAADNTDDTADNSSSSEVCDVMYGVQDFGLNNTQFVLIDLDTLGIIRDLGPRYPGYDIEGLDINAANELYASSGDDTDKPGMLYKVDPLTGNLIEIGQICFEYEGQNVCGTEMSAISFNPLANGLSGWSEECGLVNINITDPSQSTLVFPLATDGFVACLSNDSRVHRQYSSHIEDLTWDSTGESVYVANSGNVEKYTVTTDSDGVIKATLSKEQPVGGNVETVEMLPDGATLIIGQNGSRHLKTLSDDGVLTSHADLGKYNDIEAIAACVDTPSEPLCVKSGDTDGWLYATDYIGDATGTDKLEIFGMAVKKKDDTITVALNSNMEPNDGYPYSHAEGGNVNFTDLVFDFGGAKYAIHFANNDNMGRLQGKGLYENVTLKDVTKDNAGWSTFSSYHNRKPDADLGDMLIEESNEFYFLNSWNTSRSIPQEIQTGNKIADITVLSASDLTEMELNESALARNGSPGTHTFGFSFPAQEDMAGNFVSYVFTECINDGIAMVNTLPSCPNANNDLTGAEATEGAGNDEPEVTQADVQEAMGSVGDNVENEEARNSSVRDARDRSDRLLRHSGMTMDASAIEAMNATITELETQHGEMKVFASLIKGLEKADEIRKNANDLGKIRIKAGLCKQLLSTADVDNAALDEFGDNDYDDFVAIRDACDAIYSANSLEDAQYIISNEMPTIDGLNTRCQSLKNSRRNNIRDDADNARNGRMDRVHTQSKSRKEQRKTNRSKRDERQRSCKDRVNKDRKKRANNRSHSRGQNGNKGGKGHNDRGRS